MEENCFFTFKYTGSGKTSQDGYELDDFRIFDK